MRIVTWNINGLRAVTKRGVGDLATLLDSLQAGDGHSTIHEWPVSHARCLTQN